MNMADYQYRDLLMLAMTDGDFVTARNAETQRLFDAPPMIFTETPLITTRKTAWKMALREMEWFLSGDPQCPAELLPWWQDQLDPNGCFYFCGYGQQLRAWDEWFDQVQYLIDGLKAHPTSRRHILTTWNAGEMKDITEINRNPATPTTCHTTIAQFFVRSGHLYMTSYQRSADILLGLPHNLIQSWALLLWLCYQTDLRPGHLRWLLGDAHIYQEPTHLQCAREIVDAIPSPCDATLLYVPANKTEFRASDFLMTGTIPIPQVTIRPKLL